MIKQRQSYQKQGYKKKEPFYVKIKTIDGSIKWVPKNASPVEASYIVLARCFVKQGKELTETTLEPDEYVVVKTGFTLGLYPGWEAQIRTKNNLAVDGLIVMDSPSTVGCNDRDEVSILVVNNGNDDISIKSGMEIAIMIIGKVPHIKLLHVQDLEIKGQKSEI